MAVLGHQNAHREGRPAKRQRRAETHHQNPLSMTGSGSVNLFSGLSATNTPGTMVGSSHSFLSHLPSATPVPPVLISFGPVPGYHHLVTASPAPSPPAPLQTPTIGSNRLFQVPDLLGSFVAPAAPPLGSSSSHPIVLDSDNEDEEENALDLDLKL
ncbi:hypothetical protein ACET3Z_016596 [Daucus carota]